MARRASILRQVERAVKGVKSAGVEVARVEIAPDGKITVIAGIAGKSNFEANEWDAVK